MGNATGKDPGAAHEAVRSALRPRFVDLPRTGGPLGLGIPVIGGGVTTIALPADQPPRSPFVLSLSEWIDLQVGMANLDRIALTMGNIRGELTAPAGEAGQLATLWQDTVFPALRAVAGDIRDYGQRLAAKPSGAMNRAQLEALFHSLTQAADAARKRADAVYAQVQQLELGCQQLRARMQDLHRAYLARAQNAAAETLALRTELEELSKALPGRQEKYHHYVTVAATTVTYAWIPLFGWIAGGTVAGTYGRLAVLEKEGIDKDAGRISEITQKLSQQERQIAILMRASQGLASMGGSFARVLPVLQHTQGLWGAIHSDLAAVAKRLGVADDAEQFAAVLDIELQLVVDGWRQVASSAADYLRHAEVVAAPDPAPFGNFRTQTVYANRNHDENHVLCIDLLGVAVNGVPVSTPVFEGQRLRWGWQTDATRQDKPETADIQFHGDRFEGVCNFPMEGRLGWVGTRM